MHHHSQSLWGSWQIAPEITFPLIAIAFLFFQRAETSGRQKIYFSAAITSAFLVILTPIGARSADYFSLHMIQHITLMMITGPLFVLATPKSFYPQQKVFKLLTHPIVSWVSYAILMVGVHLPVPHSFIMNNPWAHSYIEVPLYIVLPYLFYFNLLNNKSTENKMTPALSVISLFLMMFPETLTGFFIYAAPNSLYENMYTLNDQRRGGSFMWAGSMIIDTVWMCIAVYHWIKSEEKKSREFDEKNAKSHG